jgi:hypothetical protein
VVVLRPHATLRAGLEHVPLGDPGDRPRRRVMHDHDGSAGRQCALEKGDVRLRQSKVLHPEVGHPGKHQPVLDRVVHVVQRDAGVAPQERLRDPGAPGAGAVRSLRVVAGPPHRHEERLRQPRCPRGRVDMRERAVGGADEHRRVRPRRVQRGRPGRHRLQIDLGQPLRRDTLAPAEDGVDTLPDIARQQAGSADE